MDALTYLLDGLEAALRLERDLGVREVACARELLEGAAGTAVSSKPPYQSAGGGGTPPLPNAGGGGTPPLPNAGGGGTPPLPNAARPKHPPPAPVEEGPTHPFVFLHHCPLSPSGSELIAKAVAAMGQTPESAPVLTAPPLPKARAYVVLGYRALRMFFPNKNGVPGAWLTGDNGEQILVTYTPEFLLRFTAPAAMKEKKRELWDNLKSVLQRTRT